MDGVKKGNAISDGGKRRGWFVGRFIDDDAFRQTHDVEVKWGVHPRGDSNGNYAADVVARTVSILIRGRFEITFRRGDATESMILDREGDYVVWLPGVEHTWEAIEDAVILTVRWPSIPVTQIEKR
jgi:hypothetical protein